MSADALDDLRAAWLATISAADRAGAQLHGAGPPGWRMPWQDAVTECWRALSLVYAGLAADRESPGGSIGDLLAGLHTARIDADRAAALAARVRWRLGATEDRLRRTREVADVVAARHLAAAITRLDLVVARLAVGGCRIERSVAALTGCAVTAPPEHSVPTPIEEPATPPERSVATPTAEPAAPPAPPRSTSHDDTDHATDADHDSAAGRADVIAHGCRSASALVTRRHRLTRPSPYRRALTMIRERRW
ncbi:hypothetical protein ACLQ29_14945 [Micromonospora sp. DT228]|uniref:hypothetical protein n=1 Tax=Micromonospora sp. DT228 TaxID=3393443 RepID=UPI003CF5F81B